MPTFCPACQSGLREKPLVDSNLRGYRCGSRHVFYTTLNEQFGGIPTADTVATLPGGTSDVQVLRFWLTDRDARQRLPNQLALVCRKFVEIAEGTGDDAEADNPFAFCPACGQGLSRFESDDLYMQGLRCQNGHEFWWRGSTISFQEQGTRANFSAELTDRDVPALVEYWLGDSKWIQPYVHPQLRGVLHRFRERYLPL